MFNLSIRVGNQLKPTRTNNTIETTEIARLYCPIPIAIPIAAEIQIVVAVVSPFTLAPSLKIAPAPKNPIPVTILEATRASLLIKFDTIVKRVDPTVISITVLKPADFVLYSLSAPIIAPIKRATKSLVKSSNTG